MDYLKKIKEYKNLSLRRQIFVRQLLLDPKRNATKAAERAGYTGKNPTVVSSQIMSDKKVKIVIAKYDEHECAEHGVIRLRIITELCLIAFSDLKDFMSWADEGLKLINSKDLPDGASRIVNEVSETMTMFGNSKKIKLYDKLTAMRELNKMLGFYPAEKHDHSSSDGSMTPNITVTLPSNGREKK